MHSSPQCALKILTLCMDGKDVLEHAGWCWEFESENYDLQILISEVLSMMVQFI